MKTLIYGLMLMLSLSCFAQKRISQYPNTGTLAPGDLFILEMGDGTTNKNIAFWQLKNIITNTIPAPADTNFIYQIAANITNYVTSLIGWGTNRSDTIPTNATTYNIDFSGVYQHYDVPILMTTNLVLSPTNLVQGRELWVFLSADNGNYDVTVTNAAATPIHWNFNGATNGSTSFTVTNGMKAELAIMVRSNNIVHAVYGHYR